MAILKIILIVVFLISALAVTIIVLSQEGKSAGLGSLSGQVGGGNSYWDKNKKYSLEGKLEKWTKIAATVFVLSALALMLTQGKGSVIPNATISTGTPEAPANEAATEGEANVEVAPEEDAATTDEEAATNEADAAASDVQDAPADTENTTNE